MRRRVGCAIGFAVVLLLISLGGVIWLVDSMRRVTGDGRVDGVIVELVESRDSDGDLVYAPIVEYEVDGTRYRLRSSVSYGGLVVPDLGEVRTVYYDPDNPADATFRGFWTLWFFPVLMVAIPLLIVLAMAVSTYRSARRRQELGVPPEWYPPGAVGATPHPVGDAVSTSDEFDWVASLEDAMEGAVDGVGLRMSGDDVLADFMGAEVSPMDAAGNVRYRIRAQAEIDGVIRRFVGPWLDADPTLDYMRVGNRVRVRMDPADPSRYRVLGPA